MVVNHGNVAKSVSRYCSRVLLQVALEVMFSSDCHPDSRSLAYDLFVWCRDPNLPGTTNTSETLRRIILKATPTCQ
jgi:hypothetical protein